MRPHRLVMQAFGPFAGREQIDFDRLGRHPLFLINGPTGAGKSTILDAICFALYGQTTGNEREGMQMRSDLASAETLTEIELTFSLGDQYYRVKRSPTQWRPKKRGEGVTEHKTQAQLWRIDADDDNLLVAKSALEATQYTESLLGLSVEQFRQVMVLPQGKFRELLLADSKEREAIFSQLFQTHIYRRLEEALKEEAAGIRQSVNDLQQHIKGLLQSVDLESEAALKEAVTELVPAMQTALKEKDNRAVGLTQADRELEAARSLAQAFTQKEKFEGVLAELLQRQPDNESKQAQLDRAAQAREIQPQQQTLHRAHQKSIELKQALEQNREQLQVQQETLKATALELDKARVDAQSLDEMKQRAAELDKQRERAQKVLEKEKALSSLAESLRQAKQAWERSQNQYQQVKTQIAQQEKRIQELKTDTASLPEHQHRLQRFEWLIQQRERLQTLENDKQRLLKKQSGQEKAVAAAKRAVQEADARRRNLELKWHSEQAAILAAELEADQPCPVCGSLDHPQPALPLKQDDAVAKTDIEQAEAVVLSKRDQYAEEQQKLVQLQTQLSDYRRATQEQVEGLGEFADHSPASLREEYQTLQTTCQQLQLLMEELGADEQWLQRLNRQRAQLETDTEQCRQTYQSHYHDHALKQQELEQIKSELPEGWRQPQQLQQALVELRHRIEAISNMLEQSQTRHREAEQAVTVTQATIKEQNVQLEAAEKEQEHCREQWQRSLLAYEFADDEAFQAALLSEPDQRRLETEVEQFNQKLTESRAALKQYQEQLQGCHPPDLEALKAVKHQRQQAFQTADERWRQLDSRYQQLKSIEQKLAESHQANEQLEQHYRIYGTLSEVANGQTGNKISLQRFVLSVLLDDVLIDASQRLYAMSKGRYVLLRREDKAKGNKASGLELEVEDAYTGTTRSVATLSGGESFMAALSLALGLSDVVQAYAGGIKLDTLFIDEGFGSLDQESLDRAIKTLVDLQAGGRMIGIISHVSELREQMPLRIDVASSLQGSHVSVP